MPGQSPPSSGHVWKFIRRSGLDQVAIESATDLLALGQLDQKLWVALACPVRGLEMDERTLGLIDSDGDGRIRPAELIAAVNWAAARLADPSALLRGADALAVASIRQDSPEGQALAAAARLVLSQSGKAESASLTVAEIAGAAPAERIPDPAVAVIGAGTAAGLAALEAVRAKVEDYFIRCRLLAFDPPLGGPANRPEGEGFVLPARTLSPVSPELLALPLAPIGADKPLPLLDWVNPAWAGALAALQRDAVAPLLGPDKLELTELEWNSLAARFAPFHAWLQARDSAPGLAAGADLERLARYLRDLRALLNNFVNFSDFYSRQRRGVFQAGTLYLDGRSCDLCTRADNPSQHAVLAAMSRLYIGYVECRRAGSPNLSIAACFTQGDSNYLCVGRNGVFYDRQGRDWDATLVKIVDNPISVRQAFFTPYKRVASFVQDQIAKFAAAKDQAATASLGQGLVATGEAQAAAKPASQPFDIAKFAGIFAAIGLALGAIGGAIASVAVGFMHLTPWQMPLAIIGALLLISGPSMIVAALKLHQRNLGPLLEASGWAVNGRVKISFTLGRLLTQRAALPPGSRRQLHDPFEDRGMHRRRIFYLALLLAAAALVIARIQGFWPFSP